MSLPQTNSKNASFDDNKIPSMLGKDPSTNETVAIMAQNGQIMVGGSVLENLVPSLSNVPGQTVGITDIFDVVTGTGDIVTAEGNTNGSRYIKISQSPFNAGTETTLTSKTLFKMPYVAESGLSLSQRLVGVETAFGVIGVDSSGAVESLPPPSNIPISGNITVATNVWTINTSVAHGLVPNDRIILIGNTDSRLNVGPVLVTAVTGLTSFTITSTLANATYTAGGSIEVVDPMRFAVNGANFIFDTATVTQAINSSRNDGNSKFQNAAYAVSTTNIFGTPAVRSESMLPSSKYSLEMYPDYNYYSNIAVDSVAAIEGGVKRTNQIPNGNKKYKVRYRCRNHSNFSIPIGRITSATKSGSQTATIVTDVPHGLTTSDLVVIQGVRDITNFPNLIAATAVASIISPTSFTIIQGSAVTASSQDGVVFKINGAGTIANLASTRGISSLLASNNELNLTISGTVTTTVLVGDTINVYGLAPALQSVYEGAYVVLDNSGSNIICRPINTDGSVRTIADIGSTPTGGMYIRRVDYIIHWTRVKEVSRQSVEIANGDTISDVSRATKVFVLGTTPVSGTVTANTTETTLVAPTVATINSAATTNATSVKATAGNIYTITLSNNGAAAAYFKLYNKATSPTVGTDTPLDVIPIPASGFVTVDSTRGIRFTTGIGFAITSLIADSDTTAVAAGQVKVHINYI